MPEAEHQPTYREVNGVEELPCVDNDKAVQTTEELDGGDGDTSDTCSTASSTCSNSSTKKKKQSSLQGRLLRKPKLKNAKKKKQNRGPVNPEYGVGDFVPVEIIYTSTVVEVVWQVSKKV